MKRLVIAEWLRRSQKSCQNGITWYAICHFLRAVCQKTSLLCTVFETVSIIFNHLPKLNRSGINKRTANNLPCVPLEWLIGFLPTCLAAKWTFHANTASCLQMMRCLPFDRSSTYDSQADRNCKRYSRPVYREGIASRGKKGHGNFLITPTNAIQDITKFIVLKIR